MGIFFRFSSTCMYIVSSHENRLNEAILMSTQNIPFLNTKKENHPKLSQIFIYGICSKGPKNEFETAVVNEQSVFEPLKF